MKVSVSCAGKFHVFHLARQLQRLGHLQRLYTAVPRWKVDKDLLDRTRTFPWVYALVRGCSRLGCHRLTRGVLNRLTHDTLDLWVARQLDPCDLAVALSGSGLHTFRVARTMGIKTVCDRGSSHIVYQDELLADEYVRHGVPYRPIPQWAVEKELQEYDEADLITVPSCFAYRSFIEKGIPESKLVKIPYGVDTSLFRSAQKQDNVFRVLYVGQMSLRKGVPYILDAFADLDLPDFELMLIGRLEEEIKPFFARYAGGFKHLGSISHKDLQFYYSQASVFVLQSIEDGFGLVLAEAMACGLPVVATRNTGAEDLFTDGVEGFIIPIRSAEVLREKVLGMYEKPNLRDDMARAALERVQSLGEWDTYGEQVEGVYRRLLEK